MYYRTSYDSPTGAITGSPVRTAGSQGFGSMGRNTTATLYRNR